jgi:ion channel-forming bestrophin family protein
MHAGRYYSLKQVGIWTRRETAIFILIATVPTALYSLLGWTWLAIPWLPIALVGTALAFLIGFKNNASYARIWEARQIWGGIINDSRAWSVMVLDFLSDSNGRAAAMELRAAQEKLIHRHIAWLTALRYQLREPRKWENMTRSHNAEYQQRYTVPERQKPLETELAGLIDADDLRYILSKKNRATHLIALQSKTLRQLAEDGQLDEFRHVEMQRFLGQFYEHQGKCERIKNFPYPRQFATLNLIFVWLFIILVPFGMLQEFQKMGASYVWMTIPASVIVCWVFHTMDKIGESSENPFEGGANDVPITAMSRTIEIDLRELLEEAKVPEALQPVNEILM